jgi:hypothetical protein
MKWTPDLLKEHYDEKFCDLNHRFDGFPQEYSTVIEADVVRKQLDVIRSDHVQRRELDEVKEALSEARGSRITAIIAVSIVMTLIGITLAFAYKNTPTSGDISRQIQIEAPWVSDKAGIEARMDKITTEDQLANITIQRLRDKIEIMCSSKPKMAGC